MPTTTTVPVAGLPSVAISQVSELQNCQGVTVSGPDIKPGTQLVILECEANAPTLPGSNAPSPAGCDLSTLPPVIATTGADGTPAASFQVRKQIAVGGTVQQAGIIDVINWTTHTQEAPVAIGFR